MPTASPDRSGASTVRDGSGPRGLVRGYVLTIVDGNDVDKTFTSDGEVCTIGTHARCRLVVRDPLVSRFHCELRADRHGVRVRDTDSLNGTRVEGVRVTEAYLEHGHRLQLGGTTVRIDLGDGTDQVPLSTATRFEQLVAEST